MASKLTTPWVPSTVPGPSAIIAAALAALAALLLYLTTATVLAWRRLRHIPGPPLAAVTNLWAFAAMARGQNHTALARAQARHGPVMRVGPAAVMVFEPAALRRLSGARSAYTRGAWYAGMTLHPAGLPGGGGTTVLSEMCTTRHAARRAKLAAGFAGRGVAMDLEADVDALVAALVAHLRAKARGGGGQGGRLDFGQAIRWFQLDLISLVGMGKAWGDLADETDHFDFLHSMDLALPFFHSVNLVPVLRSIFFSELFLSAFAPKITDETGWGRSLGEMRAAVRARFEAGPETKSGRQRGDMLGEWIKHGLSPEECELDLSIQMPAGTETTITVIRGTLLHLLTSPAAYHKVKQEIAGAIKAGRVSRPMTNDEAKEMPYLLAAISEGMRMVPPVISGFPKRVPAGGDTICGKFLPEGTDVYNNLIAMTMNPDVFGADAGVFRPERFLECDAATRAHMLTTVDLCFGHGRWLCLGKDFAKMEINKVLVELLRVFDFQIIHAERPWIRKGYSSSIIESFDLRIWENPLDEGGSDM